MRSTLALSTSIPLLKMMWPKTIPYFTIKWHFSQFKTKFFSIHLCRTSVRLCKHWSNESPKTEKSSINTSRNHSTISEKILNMHRWNIADALHNLNVILLYAKVPKGQVKVIFSWSFLDLLVLLESYYILSSHLESNKIHGLLIYQAFDQ